MESNDIKLNDTTHTTTLQARIDIRSAALPNPKECSNSMRPQKSSLLADNPAVQYEEQQWFERIRWSNNKPKLKN